MNFKITFPKTIKFMQINKKKVFTKTINMANNLTFKKLLFSTMLLARFRPFIITAIAFEVKNKVTKSPLLP